MRIAVSGTHFMGKSTLIEDFIKRHPDYKQELEPYDQLQEVKDMELSVEPSLDSMLEELDYSIKQLNQCAKETNIIFDRCPVDFISYAISFQDMVIQKLLKFGVINQRELRNWKIICNPPGELT